MKKLLFALGLIILLSGYASVNFSSKYYTLPADYQKDIDEVWNDMMTKVPLKHELYYFYRIVKDNQTSLAGVPEIRKLGVGSDNNMVVLIPEYFIKYVYEFYYPKYHKEIISCLFAHELGHPESGYSSENQNDHFLCDKYSIKNLLLPPANSDTYYSMLIVVKQYWSARKGIGGHLFNFGLNLATITYLKSTIDLFGTDLNYRISKFNSSEPPPRFCFKRSNNSRMNKEIANPISYLSNSSSTQNDTLTSKPALSSFKTLGMKTLDNDNIGAFKDKQ